MLFILFLFGLQMFSLSIIIELFKDFSFSPSTFLGKTSTPLYLYRAAHPSKAPPACTNSTQFSWALKWETLPCQNPICKPFLCYKTLHILGAQLESVHFKVLTLWLRSRVAAWPQIKCWSTYPRGSVAAWPQPLKIPENP